MSSAADIWLCLLLLALFGLLLFLRVKFPNASRGSETAVLVSATILFFSICSLFPSPQLFASPRARHATQLQETHR